MGGGKKKQSSKTSSGREQQQPRGEYSGRQQVAASSDQAPHQHSSFPPEEQAGFSSTSQQIEGGYSQGGNRGYGRGEGRGQRYGRGEGRGQSYGRGEGRGQSYGRGEDRGQRYDRGEGRGQRYDREEGRGQRYDREEGRGQRYDRGEGRGQSYDRGEGRGQSYDRGEGRGQSYSRGEGRGQSYGRGEGRGQSYGRGEGRGQRYDRGEGRGQRYDRGEGRGQSYGRGEGRGHSYGRGFGQEGAEESVHEGHQQYGHRSDRGYVSRGDGLKHGQDDRYGDDKREYRSRFDEGEQAHQHEAGRGNIRGKGRPFRSRGFRQGDQSRGRGFSEQQFPHDPSEGAIGYVQQHPVYDEPSVASGPSLAGSSSPVSKQELSVSFERLSLEKATKDLNFLEKGNAYPWIPVRPNRSIGGTKGRRTIVETNHFPVDISNLKNKYCVHYDLDIQPDKPKRLLRFAVEEFRRKYFPKWRPAFDGKKNWVASTFLPGLEEGKEITEKVSVQNDERDKEMVFTITAKCVSVVDLTCLSNYMAETNLEMPQKALQMLNIVFHHGLSFRFTKVGQNSFFSKPDRIIELGNGLHMWYGSFHRMNLGWKPFLNVDVAHKGFHAAKNVVDVIEELLGTPYRPFDRSRQLDSYQLSDVTVFLKGLKVEYMIPGRRDTKRICRVNSARGTSEERFKMEGEGTITVYEYFRKHRNYTIQYPKMPCLHVGNANSPRPILYPAELCTVVEGQVSNRKMNEQQTTKMIRHAATPADIRKSKIQECIKAADFNQDPCIKEFGLKISSNFATVEARMLNPPSLEYCNGQNVNPIRGVWRAQTFNRGCQISKWFVVNYRTRIYLDKMREFVGKMINIGQQLGMKISEPEYCMIGQRDPPTRFKDLLIEYKKCKAELVVVIIDKWGYQEVKRAAELDIGLLTQCLKELTVSKAAPTTVSNVLLKINSKMNGVNHVLSRNIRPKCLRNPAMIMGADVTHPPPEQKNMIPSVAAVCASHDPDGFQYNWEFSFQPPGNEIIEDLENIVRRQLKFFHSKTNLQPHCLIFYRDGVSEGQFETVMKNEILAIRRACISLNSEYKPPITFLVVQKRHHTRFFPTKREDEDKNKNVPAGTIVDTTITHPSHIDFYLVSHASIQGTSRPTKYRVLWDDCDMSVDEVEELTYFLCHLFSRCTRSVSYPAPTYYAHLAASRARLYLDKHINMDKLALETAARAIKQEFSQKYPMFFV